MVISALPVLAKVTKNNILVGCLDLWREQSCPGPHQPRTAQHQQQVGRRRRPPPSPKPALFATPCRREAASMQPGKGQFGMKPPPHSPRKTGFGTSAIFITKAESLETACVWFCLFFPFPKLILVIVLSFYPGLLPRILLVDGGIFGERGGGCPPIYHTYVPPSLHYSFLPSSVISPFHYSFLPPSLRAGVSPPRQTSSALSAANASRCSAC